MIHQAFGFRFWKLLVVCPNRMNVYMADFCKIGFSVVNQISKKGMPATKSLEN